MKKKGSSLQILVAIIAIAILGMLLIPAVNAYWVKEMEVKMEIDNRETSDKEITISRVEGEKARVNFKAIIDCQSHLDIIEIDKKRNIFLIFSSDSPDDYTNGNACEIRKSFMITPEETTEDYDVIFLSPGIDNYGADQTIKELLEYWKSLKSKTSEVIVDTIRSNTVGISGSGDLMTVRKIKVRTEEPKIDIDWTIENGRLEIYGTTNLPEDTIIEWRFIDPSIRTEGNTEVSWNRRIRFTINDINAKEIRGNLILEKDGKFIAEKTIIWPIPIPMTEKIAPYPILTKTPISPVPVITGRPSPPPEIPDITLLSVFLAIATAAFLKRKKHFRDQ